VARLRVRRRPCGADSTSCSAGGTHDVATATSGSRTYAGRHGDKRCRLSSLSAVHHHSWLARLEGLPRRRSRSRRHDLRFHGRWNIANRIRANAKKLGVSEVIYRQRIWTVQRSWEGGVRMSDRGSPIASRTYHVDVSVYGNRAAG
jgi:hypothetical protein